MFKIEVRQNAATSVEFTEIKDGCVNVMHRYTIGGSDDVRSCFTLELIELKTNILGAVVGYDAVLESSKPTMNSMMSFCI